MKSNQSWKASVFISLVATLALASTLFGCATPGPKATLPAENPEVIALLNQIQQQFLKFDPNYLDRKKKFEIEIAPIAKVVAARQQNGEDSACLGQILTEVQWLLRSSADFERIERRIQDLKTELQNADPLLDRSFAAEGSFGRCFEETFLKLATSTTTWAEILADRQVIPHAPKFLSQWNTPTQLEKQLERTQRAVIEKSGYDPREEYLTLIQNLSVLIRKRTPPGHSWDPKLKAVLKKWFSGTGRSDQHGLWGIRYESSALTGAKAIVSRDLEISALAAEWAQLSSSEWEKTVRSLLDLRDPQIQDQGRWQWLTIAKISWPHLTADTRTKIGNEIQKQIEQSLTTANLGRLTAIRDHLRFLVDAGYFRAKRRFWRAEAFPNSGDYRSKIRAAIESNPDQPGESESIKRNALNLIVESET